MNIGFDLDKVFINHPPLIPSWLINKLYGERANGHLSYRIPGKLEQSIRKLSHATFLRPGIKENIDILKGIASNHNFHLFLISSRYGFLEKETKQVIEKNQLTPLFTQMDFNVKNKQPHLFKDIMITKRKIQRYVDDDLPLLEYLAPRHQKTLFFWLNGSKSNVISKNLHAIIQLSSVFENI